MNRTITIKAALGAILLLCPASTLLCQAPPGPPITRPGITVDFENEVLTLAKGFEKAFKELPSGGKYIEISGPDGPTFLEGSVRSVKALEGVLLIRMEQGLVYAISARNIIKLTNQKPAGG